MYIQNTRRKFPQLKVTFIYHKAIYLFFYFEKLKVIKYAFRNRLIFVCYEK